MKGKEIKEKKGVKELIIYIVVTITYHLERKERSFEVLVINNQYS